VFQVEDSTYRAMWQLLGLIMVAGWIAFGIIGHGNKVFLAIMVIYTVVAFAGFSALVRRRPRAQ